MELLLFAGLGLGLALGGSLVLLVAALRGWRPPSGSSSRLTSLDPAVRNRAALAAAAGVAVALVTRWPVVAVAAAAVVWLGPSMLGGAKAGEAQIARLEALATWTESLRDTIAGSVGLEQAIRSSLDASPAVLRPQLQRLVGRLNARVPLPQALAEFGNELADPAADLGVTAMIQNSQLRGPGLVDTLSRLAIATREELDLRRRTEASRRSLRRQSTIIVAVIAVFGAFLSIWSREFMAPYSTPEGQLVLALVLAIVAGGLTWMRRAADAKVPERFLIGADKVVELATPRLGGFVR